MQAEELGNTELEFKERKCNGLKPLWKEFLLLRGDCRSRTAQSRTVTKANLQRFTFEPRRIARFCTYLDLLKCLKRDMP